MSNHWKNHVNRKIDPEDIPLIHALYAEGLTQRQIAEKFEITNAHVSKILKGKTWKHLVIQSNIIKQQEDPLNNKCHCGGNAVIFQDGIYECGSCWAQAKAKAK
jgi:transcriptional regulator